MRKWMTAVLTAAILLSCGITAFAVETQAGGENGQVEIGVYAKTEYHVEGVYLSPIENGKADVTTDDGISVGVADAPEGALRLMAVPVPETEREAWKWITDSLKATAKPVHVFDIYFEDQDGNRIDADGAVVTIHCPHCAGVPIVCSLDTAGTVHVLTVSSGTISRAVTFTTNGSAYYMMAEELRKHNVGTEDKPGGDVTFEDPEIPDTPQTGDNSKMWLWWLLLIASATGIAVIGMEQKKRNATK